MFNIEVSKTCTLQQACEWIAFKWEPMIPQYEEYCNHIRPRSPEDVNPLEELVSPSPKPTYTWEKYNDEMHKAKAKLTIALLKKDVVAMGRLKVYKKCFLSAEKQDVQFDSDDILNWQSNTIMHTLAGANTYNDLLIREDIEIEFEQLKQVFPHDCPERSKTIFQLVYEENDCVYLYTGNIQKTLVKKFATKTDNKAKNVIKYIMHHPGQLITQKELIKLNIKGFDATDRIDNIIKNAFSNLNIYKFFFVNPKTASVTFIEQITNTDLHSAHIDLVVTE